MRRAAAVCALLLPLLLAAPRGAGALDNGLALTPPMGWRSWNCDHLDVSDKKIRRTVDAITDRSRGRSLRDAGYNHVGIDDGWQVCDKGYNGGFHADDGSPLVNKNTFPDLKGLVDYGHGKGVLMGWYQINCHCLDEYKIDRGGAFKDKAYAGDVKLVMEAGFDGVKIDNCGDDNGDGFEGRMRHYNASSRPVLVENSNQGKVMVDGKCGNPARQPHDGKGNCPKRGNPTSSSAPCPANFFRTGGDIGPNFNS
eukprot:gene9362-3970_t